MKKEIKEQVKDYYNYLKENVPKSIEYLDYINDVIICTLRIKNRINKDSDIMKNDYELNKFEDEDIRMLIRMLLKSIDPEYAFLYKKYAYDKKIHIIKNEVSHTKARGIYLEKTHDVDEILTTLHEFAHYTHLKNCGGVWTDEFSYSSEMFAMTFDFYGMFYMYKNNILVEDTLNQYLNYINCMYNFSANILGTAIALNMYEKFGKITPKNREIYAKLKDINPGVLESLDSITFDELDYNTEERNVYKIEYEYLFGLPLSYYMGNRMVLSEAYKYKFISNFSDINNIGVDKFLNTMGVDKIINDPDMLYLVMQHMYGSTEQAIYNNKLNNKRLVLKKY